MAIELSLTEKLSYSTVRIECQNSSGQTSSGSGYFFKFREDASANQHIPVAITNKHVVQDAKNGTLIFSKSRSDGQPDDRDHFQVYIDDFESLWRFHPSDAVDLCAMPIAPFVRAAEGKGETLFYIPLDLSIVPNETQLAELSAIEEIVMVGYPNGIWDSVNNKPIFRKGITATHPHKDYNGRKEFMIDMACFPGSSGSPVFVLNEGGYRDKRGNMHLGRSRLFLLGTLYAGPQHTATGEVKIVDVPTVQKPISISTIPNHLGLVIKSTRIREMESLF
jgi:hypothetical protein